MSKCIVYVFLSSLSTRQLATGSEIGRLHSGALGLHADATGNEHTGAGGPDNADRREKKAKKPQSIQKQVAGKISMLSGKTAEIMSWDAKVKDSDRLFLDFQTPLKINLLYSFLEGILWIFWCIWMYFLSWNYSKYGYVNMFYCPCPCSSWYGNWISVTGPTTPPYVTQLINSMVPRKILPFWNSGLLLWRMGLPRSWMPAIRRWHLPSQSWKTCMGKILRI